MKSYRWDTIMSSALRHFHSVRSSSGIATLLLLVFLGMTSLQCFSQCRNERSSVLIDRNWKFHLGDVDGAEVKSYPDGTWQPVNLPHSFSVPYFLSPKVYSGYGWYRKTLNISCLNNRQRYFLEFDGVFRVAKVYVNGIRVGKHSGGYTGFSIDITPALSQGSNVVAISVNNLWNARLNPRAGEHVFSGGIYRHVRLVETSNLHVTWYGTFITTPHLDEEEGSVHINTEIRNEATDQASFALMTTILDPEGRSIASVRTSSKLDGSKAESIDQDVARVDHPQLWSPMHPALYTAITSVLRDGKEVDRYRTTFGFRWMEWTADRGFFLNGKHLYFHGANVHQDHAGWGDAVSDDGIARDIRMMKQAGMDFIRGSHYPHSPIFADECDHQGILFWSENSFWGIGGEHEEGKWTASAYPPHEEDQKAFEESVDTSLSEMIRINRNHPSIVAWSLGNEVFFSDSELMSKIRRFLKRLVEESHALDPTRPVGIGGVQRGELDHIGDIAGYNGDGARLFQNPGVPNIVGEYGSAIAYRPGKYEANWGELTDQPQFQWRSGQAIWCGFDHGSIVPDLAHMGIVDYFRIPKRSWYWYRNAYAGIAPPKWPVKGTAKALRLSSDANTIAHADGRGSIQLTISVLDAQGEEISNAPSVKLEILSGPGELPTGRSIVFEPDSDISISDGKAAIEMRAYESGEIHLRASSPGLQSSDLMIRSEGGPLFVAGKTRIAPDRAYPKPESDGRELGHELNTALNHPTEASSEISGHEARFANDDDLASYWEPAAQDKQGGWWQVEFENKVQVNSVQVHFKDGKDRRYEIQLSNDDKSWKSVSTHLPNAEVGKEILDSISPTDRTGISLRIHFEAEPSDPIQLTDVHIFGRPVL